MESKLRKVKLTISEEPLEGYIARAEDEPRTRYNTWNGWEKPYFTLEQVKAWLPTQKEYSDMGCDIWELEFNEETQEEELLIYDVDNCKLADSLEAYKADNGDELPFGNPGDGYIVTKNGVFTDEIKYTLMEAPTIDGETIKVFGSPCYTWELAYEQD